MALARAFFQQPDVIIADDPLAAVDAAVAQHLFRSLRAYTMQTGGKRRAVVLAMNQEYLMAGCDRVIRLSEGRQLAPDVAAVAVDAVDIDVVAAAQLLPDTPSKGSPAGQHKVLETPLEEASTTDTQSTYATDGDSGGSKEATTSEVRTVGTISSEVTEACPFVCGLTD